jgi:hypothetical protein
LHLFKNKGIKTKTCLFAKIKNLNWYAFCMMVTMKINIFMRQHVHFRSSTGIETGIASGTVTEVAE